MESLRSQLSEAFRKRTGSQPYTPYLAGALLRTMVSAPSLSERVYAWLLWRSVGNASEYAVSDWNPKFAKPLDQIDCALDLAWLEQGKSLDWVEKLTEEYREKARTEGSPERPLNLKLKQRISEAFARNADLGRTSPCRRGQPISIVLCFQPSPGSPDKIESGFSRTSLEDDPAYQEFFRVRTCTGLDGLENRV